MFSMEVLCSTLSPGRNMSLMLTSSLNMYPALQCHDCVRGYDSGPSTEDVTHNRRSGRVAPDIDFSGNMRVCAKMEPFLSNGANTQRLIILLIRALHCAGYGSIQASVDAGVLIGQTTLQIAETSATYTDLLVLLLQHTPISCHDVFFVPGRSNASIKAAAKIWHTQRCQVDIGPRLCHNMLFAHAIGVCDTTPLLYGFSKNVPLKRLSADDTSCRTQRTSTRKACLQRALPLPVNDCW